MRVVGIGASAGGLQAMAALLDNLPSNTGAAFVLVQHLSPHHKSIMDELLAKYTEMPIRVVEAHTHLQANHVYTLSNDVTVTLASGMLRAHPRENNNKKQNIHLPIDQFFHSLGESLKEKAMAVILSGSGTDGSRGARTIKEAGGLVFVQKPEEAKFDGMPNTTIRLGLADQILPLEELAKVLTRILLLDKESTLNGTEPDLHDAKVRTYFQQIVDLVSHQSSIDFSSYRNATLLRRTQNRMLLQHCQDLAQYLDFLKKDNTEPTELAKDFLIGVTRFFRNEDAYKELKEQIIPAIFTNKSKKERLRIWVPACSTGEEAYSIAMLIDSYIKKMKLPHDYKIFASDVDQEAIHIASKGEYPSSIIADVDPDLLLEYFVQRKDFYHVKAEIKDKILFAVHNILADPPFIHLDLISCRNLFIYLKPRIQRKVLGSFHFALYPNGCLFLGPSESIGEAKHAFNRIGKKANVFRKKEGGNYPVPTHDRSGSGQRSISYPIKHIDQADMNVLTGFDDSYNPFDQYLIDRFAPTCIFLNEELDILYSQGDLEKILTLPRALARMNLYKMMDHQNALLFRNGVQKALISEVAILYKDVTLSKKDKVVSVDLKFSSIPLPTIAQSVVMVHISKQKEMEQAASAEKVQEVKTESLVGEQIISLEHELRLAKQQARQLINELEATNEELHSANRELMATNEELQSTNEELQSVNEELYTVNSELQLKNEELLSANDDIRNLLRSTEIGTIFLDSDLQIRRFTPAIKQQFNLMQSDIGRSITNFKSSFDDLPLERICRNVYETLEVFEKAVVDRKGYHYLLRILPYRTTEDIIQGLVITFIDINDIVKAEEEVYEWATKYQAIFKNSNDIIVELEPSAKIIKINRDLAGYKKEKIIGEKFVKLLTKKEAARFNRTLKKMFKEENSQNIDIPIQDANTKQIKWYDTCFIPTPEDEAPNGYTATLIVEDITDYRARNKKLEQTLSEYEQIIQNAKHQIALVDKEGSIKHINYTQHSGMSVDEMVGTSIYDHLSDAEKEKFSTAIQNVFDGAPFEKIQFTYQSPTGKEVDAELIVTPALLKNKVQYATLIGYMPQE